MKVAVLGAAGGIGQPLSLLLKNGLPSGSVLALNDVALSTPGVAVDLSHIPTAVSVIGSGPEGLATTLEKADIVLIPAGVPRKNSEMDRAELFAMNAGIAKGLAEAIAQHCPSAMIGVITNPVNSTVPIMAEVLKGKGVYDKRKLFGITTLDVLRSEAFVAEILGKNPNEVKVPVIGGHSGKTILPLLSQVPGLNLSATEIEKLTTRIQNAGTEVVAAKGVGGGSATLSMAVAAYRFCTSLLRALQGETVQEYAYVDNDSFDTKYFAGPILIGRDGCTELQSLGSLSPYEKKVHADMITLLQEDVALGINFIIRK
jgi:malate dehydrogenase